MDIGGAVIGHILGDYLLQNDYLANGKKQSTLICLLHATIWTVSVCVCADCWNVWAALWLLVTHFAIDRSTFVAWWMDRVSGQSGFKRHLAPWSIIAVDNAFHLLTILIVAKLLPGE